MTDATIEELFDQRSRRPALTALRSLARLTGSAGPAGFLESRTAPMLANSTQFGDLVDLLFDEESLRELAQLSAAAVREIDARR